MKNVLYLLIAVFSLSACAQNESVNISPTEAEEKINTENVLLLDVRTAEEFAEGHIESATNIDFYASNFQELVNKLDKEKTYVVYCRSGGRSGKSVNIMTNMGFADVYNLDGGIINWKGEGKKLVK